ncbi:MAG: type I-C CRISPR-associated protein Cas8c/Csd1, partial [Candidatus Binatia bacterium]
LIDLNKTGKFLNFVPTTEGKEGRKERGKPFDTPHIGRSSGIRAKLLADTGEYVLGLAREEDKQDRVDECHRAFIEQIRACATAINEPAVNAVLKFMEEMKRSSLRLPDGFNPGDNLTFRVDGVLPIHLKSVQNYWASVAGGTDDEHPATTEDLMECLICGQLRQPVKRHQFKIKRIPGGQTSGMALISANATAFESYGLQASLIAPTCEDCGERFTKAANALIEGATSHITVGPLVYIFWTKEERDFSIASLLSKPEPDEVRALIDSAFSGRQAATHIDTTPFYATAFSASGGRVVVRDWIDTPIQEVRRNLARYFALQTIVERDGTVGHPYGLYALAASTVRDANRDLPPQVPKVLLHVALNGGPLPLWLLFQAVKRNRAEGGITRNRAALIKMVLLTQQPEFTQEEVMASLDVGNRNTAYLCGRLLAVLEAIQYQAVRPKATLVDRFYGTASSAPASVFGHLLRGGQNHLTKLRKESPGAHTNLQKRLEEILDGIDAASGYPRVLTLQEQGLFGLGYYHQRAADRSAAIARKQSAEEKGKSAPSSEKAR